MNRARSKIGTLSIFLIYFRHMYIVSIMSLENRANKELCSFVKFESLRVEETNEQGTEKS